MRVLKFCLALLLLLSVSAVFAGAPAEGRPGRAEVRFMEGIIDHHQMAIDMSNVCLQKAQTEEVLALCQEIIDKQSAEISTLQGWLMDWYNISYAPMSMDSMMEQMGGMEGMEGMESDNMDMPEGTVTDPATMMGMMAFFNRTEGQEFEVAYLEAMADHHDDAINMAERGLREGEHQELLDMAQQMIDDQMAEIERIEELLTQLNAM